MEKGFDNKKYLELQTQNILKRINQFNNKLYLEFGGKLFDDLHASRVLPGFEPNAKIQILKKLKDKCEIIFVISAKDIEKNKIRADFGITYDMEVLRQIDNLRNEGLTVSAVVITLFDNQPQAKLFATKLERRNERVYFHTFTKGYPSDVDTIVSDEGYGANPYIETKKPLVVITAPGPGSGKLGTSLSQLYHEYKKGIKAGYAKFETFPVWNLELKHPVNIAYEAATAEMKDVNMIDSFHYNAYGKVSINYNRDLEIFPVVNRILTKITGNSKVYQSPTDMGVNMVGFAITDDEVCRQASKDEVIRRFYRAQCDYKKGITPLETAQRIELLMSDLDITAEDRKVVEPALEKAKQTQSSVVAIELSNKKIITGRNKELLSASAACVLNALKTLSHINDNIDLIPAQILEPVLILKRDVLKVKYSYLNLKDVLITLSVSATTNPIAKQALDNLKKLKGCQAHSTFIMNQSDADTLRRLGIELTCEPKFSSKNLSEI